MTACTARRRPGRSFSFGTRYGILASRILPLARTSLCAIVASGTRKALAISAVVSPPRSRSVSATWTPVDRAVAGGGDDPSRRARRQSSCGPTLHSRRERVLDGFLGDVDVTEHANQDRDRATVLLAKDTFDLQGPNARHVGDAQASS